MSEASDSLHIRTDDAEGCIAKLCEAGVNGFVFRGDRGWLTVVPYADPARDHPILFHLAEHLAPGLRSPIIAYSCHEDFVWSFLLAMPDGRSTEFACLTDAAKEWTPPDGAELPVLDEAMLAEVADLGPLRPFLAQSPPIPGEGGAAYGFAQALGFPAFKWVSPFYVWQDPEGARRCGGEEIGRHPASEAQVGT